MRKMFVALCLLFGVTALSANFALAVEDQDGTIGLKMITSQMAQELQSRAARLGTSAGTSDTTFVGYTPGHIGPDNYWSIYAGFGKDGFSRPVNGQPSKGLWNWDEPVQGDSLQGWTPFRILATEAIAGGTDRNRPHTCIDYGNQANYIGKQGRTFGVDGVWHVDGGSLITVAGVPAPTWVPIGGLKSAWMGLRAHGDNSHVDPITLNPFNENLLVFNQVNGTKAGGAEKRFPGYGSCMDQILYRDINLAGALTEPLTVTFTYRTNMSTSALGVSRFGWFNHDPVAPTVGATNPQPNNFISGMDAGTAGAPIDSFMVYVGSPVDGDNWRDSQGASVPVYDAKHRWFAEVLHADWDPLSPPAAPLPRYYKELLSVKGDNAATTVSYTIQPAVIANLLASHTKIRLAFRVKTNLYFDDERAGGRAYSSNGAGAAVVDDVSYQIGTNPVVVLGDFESAGSINNNPKIPALDAWKSTGKPPAVYHHVEQLSNVRYQDICGQKGDITRICNMTHGIVSVGNHDDSERSGGDIVGQAERDRREGFAAPVIKLAGPYTEPGGKNSYGLYPIGGNGGVGDIDASEDYYIRYDCYAGIYDGNNGNFWRAGVQSYPSRVADAVPAYPNWGPMRQPGYVFFQPVGRQCFIDNFPLGAYALIKTTNASGIPDSIRISMQHLQLCYSFGVSAGCSPTDGAYWDNVAFELIDGTPSQLAVDIWQWFQDAYPANETPGYPGNAALFDTTSAWIQTGLNTAQDTNDRFRYNVAGDSVAIQTSGDTKRLDMVFRILPGPGNYNPIGDGHAGNIRRVPTNAATVTPNDGSWWDVYRRIPGDFATNPAGMTDLKAGWNPNFWLSARCDTAEQNLYALQGRGILGGPANPSLFQTTYHEADAHYAALGIVHNKCFVMDQTGSLSNIICDGTVPTYLPVGTLGTTLECTKIIPDGMLTPGAHVQYFFRDQKGTEVPQLLPDGLCPDTTTVFTQISEGPNFDRHRWQEFSVLPDRWKDPQYLHPIFQTFGSGPAKLLVIDWNDRRGDEGIWVSIADTIGATAPKKFGAHNGWHQAGTADINDPAGFVSVHGGSPGTTWDMYQMKACESIDDGVGSLGARLGYRGGDPLVANKSARNAPTPEMLSAYYTLMLILSGDLNSNLFSPFDNRPANDCGIITGWLTEGSTVSQDRGIWGIGDGFVEANTYAATDFEQYDLITSYFRADLVDRNFQQYGNVSDGVVDLLVYGPWQGKEVASLYGMRNQCVWTNDVVIATTPELTSATGEYQKKGAPSGGPYYSGIFKDWDPASPWKALVDGWDLYHLTTRNDINTVGRSLYMYKVFINVWNKIWPIAGTPIVPLDVPTFEDGSLVNFMNVAGNPMYAQAKAVINFGLARADKVEIKVYDVTGRLIRTVADRQFAAGPQKVEWDGLDNGGKQVARGVYFTQVKFAAQNYLATKKLIVLK
jgi:hypothetical protein